MPQVLMPALSPTMEEGNLAKWVKKEGDKIVAGDVIAEIETDKATMEVEAVDEGMLRKILIPAGTEGVKVNTPIAVHPGRGRRSGCPSGQGAKRRKRPRRAAAEQPAQAKRRFPPHPRLRRHRLRPIPTFRPARRWCRRPCAKRCAMRWPKRCAATRTSS